MAIGYPAERLVDLIRELCMLPRETEWIEFKQNYAEPREIGEYISTLANAAALCGKPSAYLVWGIEDSTFLPGLSPEWIRSTVCGLVTSTPA